MVEALRTSILRPGISHRRAHGFTLIEVLVALMVFAIAMAALVQAGTQRVQNLAYLRQRTVAAWIASNRIAWLRLQSGEVEAGTREGEVEMVHGTWFWTARIEATADDTVWRVEVAVRASEEDEPLARVTGFLSTIAPTGDSGGNP